MLNDDPVYPTLGIFHYPKPFRGFKRKPTDYWYRPWHLYHRIFKTPNASTFCFGNDFNFDLQLDLTQAMARRYWGQCYFSFTLITDVGHDNCENLELLDDRLKRRLQFLYESNSLNKTVLILMSDHGQRIHNIRHATLGRAEERMPLFTILFPRWFQQKYPKLMDNFRANRNRLTSHYDVYQTLKDIADGNYDGVPKYANSKFPRSDKGLSLLHRVVPTSRSCADANVPANHCICMVPNDPPISAREIRRTAKRAQSVILNYTAEKLANLAQCQRVDRVDIFNLTRWTLSQIVQHGVREIQNDTYESIAKRKLKSSVEFLEIEYLMIPINVKALIRLEHNFELRLLFVVIDPMVIIDKNLEENRVGKNCSSMQKLPKFCKCIV